MDKSQYLESQKSTNKDIQTRVPLSSSARPSRVSSMGFPSLWVDSVLKMMLSLVGLLQQWLSLLGKGVAFLLEREDPAGRGRVSHDRPKFSPWVARITVSLLGRPRPGLQKVAEMV